MTFQIDFFHGPFGRWSFFTRHLPSLVWIRLQDPTAQPFVLSLSLIHLLCFTINSLPFLFYVATLIPRPLTDDSPRQTFLVIQEGGTPLLLKMTQTPTSITYFLSNEHL